MRYHATDPATPDRLLAADRARWLHSRPLSSTASLDLIDQLAEFWENDDLQVLREAGAIPEDTWLVVDED